MKAVGGMELAFQVEETAWVNASGVKGMSADPGSVRAGPEVSVLGEGRTSKGVSVLNQGLERQAKMSFYAGSYGRFSGKKHLSVDLPLPTQNPHAFVHAAHAYLTTALQTFCLSVIVSPYLWAYSSP